MASLKRYINRWEVIIIQECMLQCLKWASKTEIPDMIISLILLFDLSSLYNKYSLIFTICPEHMVICRAMIISTYIYIKYIQYIWSLIIVVIYSVLRPASPGSFGQLHHWIALLIVPGALVIIIDYVEMSYVTIPNFVKIHWGGLMQV